VGRWQHQRWVREVTLPELRRLADAGGHGQGAETVGRLPCRGGAREGPGGGSEFVRILSQVSIETSIDTTPQGAAVYTKSYEEPEAPWELVGTTPVLKYRAPFAPMRFKVEKPGYETFLRTVIPGKYDAKTRSREPGRDRVDP